MILINIGPFALLDRCPPCVTVLCLPTGCPTVPLSTPSIQINTAAQIQYDLCGPQTLTLVLMKLLQCGTSLLCVGRTLCVPWEREACALACVRAIIGAVKFELTFCFSLSLLLSLSFSLYHTMLVPSQ